MRILGIESSCDECSIALLDGKDVKMYTATQAMEHAEYHGIVPEVASRRHVELISLVCRQVLGSDGINSIDGIAVSNRPGLSGSLAVGLNFAKALSYSCSIPYIAVHHILAHAYAIQLEQVLDFPYLAFIVSGGHSFIAEYTSYDNLLLIGETVDDACGEVFDKVADYLGLGYPGAAALDALARKGDPKSYRFPRPKVTGKPYDLSYSGLKTALIHQRDLFRRAETSDKIEDIAAAFEAAAVDMLFDRLRLLRDSGNDLPVVFCGGVAANSYLRERALQEGAYIPSTKYCVDNAAMIAALGAEYLQRGQSSDFTVDVISRTDYQRKNA